MYPFLLKTYQRLLHFLRMPDDRSFARVSLSFKVRAMAGLLLLNVFLACIWLLVFYLLGKEDLENVNSRFMMMPFWKVVLMGVLFIPFLEEVIFRFPLKYSRNYVLQFLIAMVALFAPAEYKKAIYANARTYWKRYFWVFFYLMTSTFAFIHIYNYVDAKQLLLWSPFLTLTQFITGLILGYIRVRFGFLWSWYYHGIFNLLFFSLAFLPIEQSREMIKTDTLVVGYPELSSFLLTRADYTLSIKKSSDTNVVFTGYYGVTPNRIYFEQCSLERIMRILTKDSITLLGSKNNRYDIEFIRLRTDMKRTSKDMLLQKLVHEFKLK